MTTKSSQLSQLSPKSSTRFVYINPELPKEASASKHSLDALAMALGIKIMFVNSVIVDATITRLMRVFHIGHSRCVTALEYAIKQGWIVREGKNLRATQLKKADAYNVRFVIPKHNKRAKQEVRCPYTITQLCNFLRQSILLYHISKQNVVYDTLKLASDPDRNYRKSVYRNARKRMENFGMCKQQYCKNGNRLSSMRMAEIANCSKSKAKLIIKQLVNDKVVTTHGSYETTNFKVEELNAVLRYDYARNCDGYLVKRNDKVFIRFANSYTLNKNCVKFVSNREVV